VADRDKNPMEIAFAQPQITVPGFILAASGDGIFFRQGSEMHLYITLRETVEWKELQRADTRGGNAGIANAQPIPTHESRCSKVRENNP